MNIEIKSQKFEVYKEDCEQILNHAEAIGYCENLGDGWRLPTLKEMLEMDDNKDELGLKPTGYWSSTELNSSYAWFYSFNYGYSYPNGKSNTYRVRAVRTI